MNVAERNRKLPKKEKYFIQKLGIISGDHTFKVERVESKKDLSLRPSTPQTERKKLVSPIR